MKVNVMFCRAPGSSNNIVQGFSFLALHVFHEMQKILEGVKSNKAHISILTYKRVRGAEVLAQKV